MKDKILEEIEAIAKAVGECPIEDVMRRGMEALEKELNPVEISRFIVELRRMKSGISKNQSRFPIDKSVKGIQND